jgi:dCMP deaminase
VAQAVRPSWERTWLDVAQLIARRSLCSRAQVGAVIVDPHNRVIATGYNGPPAGFLRLSAEPLGLGETCEHWCQRARDPYADLPEPFRSDPTWTDPKLREFYHAPSLSGQLWPGGPATGLSPAYEDCPSLHAEANALMAADRSTWQGGTIYVTGCVCFTCSKLVANSGLKRVVYLDDSADRAYRQPERVDEFLRSCGLVVDRQARDT